MEQATRARAKEIHDHAPPEEDRWFLIEKGERKGWFWKYYLFFYSPATHECLYYKCGHDEYMYWSLGEATRFEH